MIPIPQYPLYTATLALNNGQPVPYYLDESSQWDLAIPELKRALSAGRKQGLDTRALVVINPGNPTGNCLSLESMQQIIQFCAQEKMLLLADEVYQTNVYDPDLRPFHSFKKVLMESPEFKKKVELISFHSISKGVIGECGRRGGYFECVNLDPDAEEQLYKLASISLCPSVQGQLMVDLMVNPPQPGDASYAQYQQEHQAIYESLKRRALKLTEAFNRMEGVSCQPAAGAMYVFPQVSLPPRAIQKAKELNKKPDTMYVLELLEATGVCMVPGSGFGQKEGTWHFRSTFLPPEDEFDEFIARLEKFHGQFMAKYRS